MISDAVLITLIGAFVTMFGVAVGAYVSIRSMIKDNTTKTTQNGVEVAAVKKIAQQTSGEVKQMTTGAFNAGYLHGVSQKRQKKL